MKYIWEEADIRGGRYVIRQSSPHGSKDMDFALTVAYKLGFSSVGKRCLVSLADGMVISYSDKSAFLEAMNNDEFGYRPLEGKELLDLIAHRESGPEGK